MKAADHNYDYDNNFPESDNYDLDVNNEISDPSLTRIEEEYNSNADYNFFPDGAF